MLTSKHIVPSFVTEEICVEQQLAPANRTLPLSQLLGLERCEDRKFAKVTNTGDVTCNGTVVLFRGLSCVPQGRKTAVCVSHHNTIFTNILRNLLSQDFEICNEKCKKCKSLHFSMMIYTNHPS